MPIMPITRHQATAITPPSLHLIARASLSRISIMPMHPRPGKIQPQQLHQRLQRHTLPRSPRILGRTSVSSQTAHITHPHTVRIMPTAVSTHLSQRTPLMHTPVKIHHIMVSHVHKPTRLMPAPDVRHTHITPLSSSRTMNNNIIYLTHIQYNLQSHLPHTAMTRTHTHRHTKYGPGIYQPLRHKPQHRITQLAQRVHHKTGASQHNTGHYHQHGRGRSPSRPHRAGRAFTRNTIRHCPPPCRQQPHLCPSAT